MLSVRNASDRFHTDISWLHSWHSFSFGEHHDSRFMGFGPLRVINEDRIHGGGGFPTHGHRDMEIITIVLEGALEHKDSLGNGSVIRPGDVQKMSAGLGILHSEANHSADLPVHLLQIWIMPDADGVAPKYQQIHFDKAVRHNQFCLVASKTGANGSITLQQDASMLMANLDKGKTLDYATKPNRNLWVQMAAGAVSVNGVTLTQGDGVAVKGETSLAFSATEDSSIILFDMGA